MTPVEVLQEVHRKYEAGSVQYPDSSSEDHVLRNSYLDDGLEAWENEALVDAPWSELITEFSDTADGTGSDDLPADFLSTLRHGESSEELRAGNTVYSEVTPGNGILAKKENSSNPVFWIAGGKIKTQPAMATGTAFTLPYVKKATRYPVGTETTDLQMSRPKFLVYFILSQLFLKDRNSMGFQANQQLALDEMMKMKLANNREHPDESDFGFGM